MTKKQQQRQQKQIKMALNEANVRTSCNHSLSVRTLTERHKQTQSTISQQTEKPALSLRLENLVPLALKTGFLI